MPPLLLLTCYVTVLHSSAHFVQIQRFLNQELDVLNGVSDAAIIFSSRNTSSPDASTRHPSQSSENRAFCELHCLPNTKNQRALSFLGSMTVPVSRTLATQAMLTSSPSTVSAEHCCHDTPLALFALLASPCCPSGMQQTTHFFFFFETPEDG